MKSSLLLKKKKKELQRKKDHLDLIIANIKDGDNVQKKNHHDGLITIRNFTELNHFILTHYNKSKMEIMRRAKERSFQYYHHVGLTTITNFTERIVLNLPT